MLATSATGGAPVAAYALRRPDGRLAVLLLNKDPRAARTVTIDFARGRPSQPPSGPFVLEQLSGAQYRWHPAGERGYARPDGPPARSVVDAGQPIKLVLPALSITVLRTQGPL